MKRRLTLSEKFLSGGRIESSRTSLARDTLLQLATIMLAGIFEGNNVREGIVRCRK